MEAPEVASGVVELKRIAREAGSRSKIAVHSDDEYIDPGGACVGQRGVRVTTVMSALGNEKIDIIEWSGNDEIFVEKALSPAEVMRVELDEDTKEAHAYVMPDQQSLAIGKGGQNARLAAKLTGWTIDIRSLEGDDEESEITVDPDGSVDADEEAAPDTEEQIEASKTKDEASNREEAPKDTDSDTEEDTSEDTAVEADEETESDKEAVEEIEGEATEEEDDEEAKEKEE